MVAGCWDLWSDVQGRSEGGWPSGDRRAGPGWALLRVTEGTGPRSPGGQPISPREASLLHVLAPWGPPGPGQTTPRGGGNMGGDQRCPQRRGRSTRSRSDGAECAGMQGGQWASPVAWSSLPQRTDLVQKVEGGLAPCFTSSCLPEVESCWGGGGRAWMSLKEGVQGWCPCPRPAREMGEIGGLLWTQNSQCNQSGGWR